MIKTEAKQIVQDVSEGEALYHRFKPLLQVIAPKEIANLEHHLWRLNNGEIDHEVHALKNENRKLRAELNKLTDPDRISVDYKQWIATRKAIKSARVTIWGLCICQGIWLLSVILRILGIMH